MTIRQPTPVGQLAAGAPRAPPRAPGRSGSRGPRSARRGPRPRRSARSRRGSSRGPRARPCSSAPARRRGSRSRPRGWPTTPGTSTVTLRPSSSASQCATIAPTSPARRRPRRRSASASMNGATCALGGRRVLEAVPGQDADDERVAVDARRRPRPCATPGDARRRGRLAEDALVAGEVAVGGEDLVVGHGARSGRPTRRAPRSPASTTPGRRSGSRSRSSPGGRPGRPLTSGAAPAAWKPHIRGVAGDPAGRRVLAEPRPVRADVAGVADRDGQDVRRAAQLRRRPRRRAVFWPSRRNGLTELTRVTGWSSCSASARTMASAWSKLPSMATTRAPAISAWRSLPVAIWPLRQDDDDLHARRAAP